MAKNGWDVEEGRAHTQPCKLGLLCINFHKCCDNKSYILFFVFFTYFVFCYFCCCTARFLGWDCTLQIHSKKLPCLKGFPSLDKTIPNPEQQQVTENRHMNSRKQLIKMTQKKYCGSNVCNFYSHIGNIWLCILVYEVVHSPGAEMAIEGSC